MKRGKGRGGHRKRRERRALFGRAMEELGVEMIPAYSPQARGRRERWNGTWQGRLVAELRLAGIADLAAANRYISKLFLPGLNRQFTQEAAEPGSAFVGAPGADLDRLFAIRHDGRVAANDNTVRVNNLTLQLEKSRFREHFAKCRVDVFEHLDGAYTVVWSKRVIGRYDSQGRGLAINPGGQPPAPGVCRLPGQGRGQKRRGGNSMLPPLPRPSPGRSGRSPALPYPPKRHLQNNGNV